MQSVSGRASKPHAKSGSRPRLIGSPDAISVSSRMGPNDALHSQENKEHKPNGHLSDLWGYRRATPQNR
jgi:hypothetical protein